MKKKRYIELKNPFSLRSLDSDRLIKHWKNTNSSQVFQKKDEGNMLHNLFLLPTVYIVIKRKLQMNIPHKHSYKNSPQNICKSISTACTKIKFYDPVGLMQGMQSWFNINPRNINYCFDGLNNQSLIINMGNTKKNWQIINPPTKLWLEGKLP